MRIIRLETENVKRIKAVAIQPNGKSVVIRGNNEQGKSSLLDSIQYVFDGKRSHAKRVIRDGAEKAHVVAELDDLVVERVWDTDHTSTLTVTTKAGLKVKSPQKMLDELIGKLSFDPLEFMHGNNKAQFDTLRGIVGVDFEDLDEQHQTYYDKRTDVNREVKRIELNLPPADPDMPAAEVSISQLVEDLQAANKTKENIQDTHNDLIGARGNVERYATEAAELEVKHNAALAQLKSWTQDVIDCTKNHEAAKDKLVDPAPIEQRLKEAEDINVRFRAAQQWREENAALEKGRAESDELTAKIKLLDGERKERVAAAKFPVPGLSFQNSEVVYEGMPFEQAAQSVKLRVSVAIGIAMNPKLRVILIREGSFLDADHLAMVGKMAEDADAQVWVEMVGTEGAGIIIEDGMVKEVRGAA